MQKIEKLNLANLPTPIEKLEKLSEKYNKNIFIKRDDFTGIEVSGNKVRKLEYAIADALSKGSDTIITTGALQSNHCRATAAVCARLGIECHLVLRGEPENIEGNLFLDYLFGSHIHIIGDDESREEEMDRLVEVLENDEKKPYTIPVGASNAIGTYGYIDAYQEIIEQEKEMNLDFDMISLAVGSGGTYAGLYYENQITNQDKNIFGISVSDSAEDFKKDIIDILENLDDKMSSFDSININDSYIGEGYAIATKDELEFYYDIAKLEGVVLDPCYTGKAFKGLLQEIENGNVEEENILFIHTGGLMGWTEEQREQIYEIAKESN